MSDRFVIVGGGLAGASAAGELRKQGFHGSIVLIGGERHVPYIRPPLSKGFLSGSESRESIDVHPAGWYDDNDVDLRLGTRVARVDRASHLVQLDDGTSHGWDRLLLATGSDPRRLPLPGAELAGVRTLRTVDDSERLHEVLKDGGRRVVLIGSGWIGMEVGATARTLGNEVTILDRDTVPLANALGEELGRVFARLHEENGVVLRPSVQVERIVGEAGAVTGVRLADGETVPADLVVMAVGAAPYVTLASEAGLDVDDGVLVDERLATSDPDVFAAGDIANALHPAIGLRLRSEHWANAKAGGRAAARSMLGQGGVYDDIPYFYTDQFDLGMEYSGYAPLAARARVVYRGDVDAREFIAFWVDGDRLVAGMNVNIWDVNEQVQALIRRGSVDVDRLTDPAIPLGEV